MHSRHLASLGAFITIVAIAIDPLTQQAITVQYREIPTKGTASIIRAEMYEVPEFAGAAQDMDGEFTYMVNQCIV